jgi:Tfp pilus assembly protein FimT
MRPRPFKPATQAGFTLAELLLVTGLLVLFAGAAVLSLGPLWRTAPLDEGVGRVEGLLRFARAEAAQHGRRVRLQVTAAPRLETSTGSSCPTVQLEWEPEPLTQPGVFVPNQSTAPLTRSLSDLVRIESIRRTDPDQPTAPPAPNADGTDAFPGSSETSTRAEVASATDPTASDSEESAETWEPITFYPDGSSDSAEILIASAESSDATSDTRRMIVRWNGLNGTADHLAAADFRPNTAGESSGPVQPLEPSSVARSAMGSSTP